MLLRLVWRRVDRARLRRALQEQVQRPELGQQARLVRGVVERREAPVAEPAAVDREELLGLRRVAGGEARQVEVVGRVCLFVGDESVLYVARHTARVDVVFLIGLGRNCQGRRSNSRLDHARRAWSLYSRVKGSL